MPNAQPLTRQADRLYDDLLSPAESVEIRERARKIAADVVAPAARRIANGDERVDGFPRDVLDGLAAAGLFRVPFAAKVGGDGLAHPVTATAVAIEELAYYSSSGRRRPPRWGMFRELERTDERISYENERLVHFQRRGAGLPEGGASRTRRRVG